MKIETFLLERNQSLYENQVRYNLTESGLHPYALKDVLSASELDELVRLPMGYGQTNGDPALRRLIASFYRGLDADNVLVTNGSAEANFALIWSLIEPGDDVSLMLPNYMLVSGLLKSLGANIQAFHLSEEKGWAPDIAELKRGLTARTKLIVVCNPNNPTGAVLDKETMEAIVALARGSNAYILSDEIYRGSELAGVECPSFADLYDRTLVCSGLSKSLAFPGLRLGWIAGPKDVVARAWHHHDYMTICPSLLSQYAATKILEPKRRAQILSAGRAHLNRNLALFRDWADGRGNMFRCVPPKAGGMVFARYQAKINSSALVEQLRTEKDVFVVAGDWFGLDYHLRFGIGTETERLRHGLDRVAEFMSTLA